MSTPKPSEDIKEIDRLAELVAPMVIQVATSDKGTTFTIPGVKFVPCANCLRRIRYFVVAVLHKIPPPLVPDPCTCVANLI